MHDEAHPATFTSSPSLMGDRIFVSGKQWLEPLGPSQCRIHFRAEAAAKVPGVSPLVERSIERKLHVQYADVPKVAERYAQQCARDPAKAVGSRQAPEATADVRAAPAKSNGGPAPVGVAPAPA